MLCQHEGCENDATWEARLIVRSKPSDKVSSCDEHLGALATEIGAHKVIADTVAPLASD